MVGLAVLLLAALQLSGIAPWAPAAHPATRPATELDPGLASAVQQAIDAAAEVGVELYVNSGWRSAAEQRELWDEALIKYGSEQEAARWVLPPELSAHVQGLAVDVGPSQGAAWLAEHGPRWGLCQVYGNEPWHYELTAEPGGTCPELVPDATALLDG